MAVEVLLVVCGSYREMGLGMSVGGVAPATDDLRRWLEGRGARVRTIDGRVTERRLERALRSLGKRVRRGDRVGVMFLGRTLDGEWAPENAVRRKPGKRKRTFSGARFARALGGELLPSGDVFVGRVGVPVFKVEAPNPLGAGGPRIEWYDGYVQSAKERADNPLQLDPGHDGFWAFDQGEWWPGQPAIPGFKARAEIFTGTQRIGVLEITVMETCRHEDWYFITGEWPTVGFRIEYVGDQARWHGCDSFVATMPKANAYDWKGFKGDPEPGPETLGESISLSPDPDHTKSTIFGPVQLDATGKRRVPAWRSVDGHNLKVSPQHPVAWGFVAGMAELPVVYRSNA